MKEFIFRLIPFEIHEDWKFFAKRKAISMRLYLLSALKSHIERDKDLISMKHKPVQSQTVGEDNALQKLRKHVKRAAD